jgi:hypothetical protein
LRDHLALRPFRSRTVARVVARCADRPWLVTWGEAFRYPQAGRPPAGIGLLHAFLDRVGTVSSYDPVVFTAFLDVMHLHRGATHLFRPDLLWRILRPRNVRDSLAQQGESAPVRTALAPAVPPAHRR